MKNIYFLSDAHLGSLAIPHGRMQERRLVRFLDSIKEKAAAIYLLGDMFDFWYEYKFVVPKGYTRFLGKLSELTDMGVEVHYFTGNHDIWAYDYLEKECGVILHKQPETTEIYGKMFYLAHGDGLGLKRPNGEEPPYMGDNKEHLVLFTKHYIQYHSNVDYFIYGHRHIELDLQLTKNVRSSESHQARLNGRVVTDEGKAKARMLILGDWINHFTYAVYDGDHLLMLQYIEGESRP